MVRVRAAVVRILDRGDEIVVIGARGVVRSFAGDSAALLRAVLEIHERPVTRDDVIAELARRAGGVVPDAPVDQLIEILVGDGVVVDATPARETIARPGRGARVVLGISGAVAAVDAPQLIRGLHAIGCDVRVALTTSAARFVAVDALDALTHHAVWRDLWQGDAAMPVPHVNLAEWADLVVVCPASATTVARIATGDCSDLVSAIVAATRAPVVIAPSMNDAMYGSPAVQANLATLRDHGRWLVHPALGVEVAHPPAARRSMLGPAPPPAVVVDVIRHVLGTIAATARPALPADPAGWERLWSTTPADRLPWRADTIDAPLADALDARRDPPGRRLVDVGTGDGTVAIDAARRGFAVTAIDVSPSALGRARARAGDLPIVFVLDDVTAPRLDARFDVAVDCGLLHCLPRSRWPGYARAVTDLVAPGGSLLVIAHQPGVDLATTPVTGDDLRALLPAFVIGGTRPTTLSRADATLFDLQRGVDA